MLCPSKTFFQNLMISFSYHSLRKLSQKKKHAILKEEERIVATMKKLKDSNEISQSIHNSLKPTSSQPLRLYNLTKIHKQYVPARPVLSMPGSAYYKIGNQISTWLSVVDECNTNSSTKLISELLLDIELM